MQKLLILGYLLVLGILNIPNSHYIILVSEQDLPILEIIIPTEDADNNQQESSK